MKKLIAFILIMLVILTSVTVYADPQDMTFDGINYLNTENTPVAFKGNVWHTGVQNSDIMLPLREEWTVSIGKSISQPIAIGDYLYALADNKLLQVSISDKSVKGSITIQTSSSPALSHITAIKNSEGWFDSDKLDRLIFGSVDGKIYCIKIKNVNMDNTWIDWTYNASDGYAITSNPVFVFDSVTEEPYIIAGAANGSFCVLDADGKLVKSVKESPGNISSPLIFHTNNSSTHSVFLYGVDAATGYISSGFVNDGEYQDNPLLNKSVSESYMMSGITGITSEVVTINGVSENVIFCADKKGYLYCISLRTGKLLWTLTKYGGSTVDNNCVPVVDDSYVYYNISNYNNTGKGKFIAVDYNKAIELGKDNPASSSINTAILYDTSDSEFASVIGNAPTIIRATVKNDAGLGIKGKLAIVGDKGSADNLRVFYTYQSDGGKAKRVKDAFQSHVPGTNSLITKDTFTLPGGMSSEPLYSGGYLFVTDGNGTLHAFSGKSDNNIALLNMQNSTVTVQQGQAYEITANIANYNGAPTMPLDIRFTLVTENDEEYPIVKENIVVPEAGLTTHLSYTVPVDYSGEYFSVRCEVNAPDTDGTRKVEETDYADNTQELRIKVADSIDLSVAYISDGDYNEKEFVTTKIEFKNTSDYDVHDIPIVIIIDGKMIGSPQAPSTINIAANSSTVVPVTWYADPLQQNIKMVNIVAKIKEKHGIVEDDYRNNTCSEVLIIKKNIPDFEVMSISPAVYKEKSRVVTYIKVRNNSSNDYVQDNKIELQININGASKTELIELPRNNIKTVPFTWTSPGYGTNVTITAEINPSHSPVETTYYNNKKTTTATITREPISSVVNDVPPVSIIKPPAGCTYDRREWSESRFDHWATRKVGTRTEIRIDPLTNEEVTYTYPIYEDYAVYKTYNFYAALSISASLSQSSMKSGYGFEATVTTNLTTNYDIPSKLAGPQDVYAYFPEHQFKIPISMDPAKSSTSFSNTWTFYVSEQSVLGRRAHYVPVWFPDNKYYTVQFIAKYAQSPGGSLCSTTTKNILINGSMYEDDATGGSR
jgi:hypothetical protein